MFPQDLASLVFSWDPTRFVTSVLDLVPVFNPEDKETIVLGVQDGPSTSSSVYKGLDEKSQNLCENVMVVNADESPV